MKVDQLSTEQVKALAVAHVRHYEYRITAGSGRVDHTRCERMLATWKGVLAKANRSPQWRLALLDAERREVQDALDSGEYEELLRLNAEPLS